MNYSVKQLCEALSITEQTFYKLLKKHKDFSEIVEADSKIVGKNKKRLYGDKCLEWLREHYKIQLVSDGVEQTKTDTEKGENPNTNPSPIDKHLDTNDLETYIDELEAKIKRQQKRIKRLKAEKERLENEVDRLLKIIESKEEKEKGYLVSILSGMNKKHLLIEEDTKKKKHWWNKS